MGNIEFSLLALLSGKNGMVAKADGTVRKPASPAAFAGLLAGRVEERESAGSGPAGFAAIPGAVAPERRWHMSGPQTSEITGDTGGAGSRSPEATAAQETVDSASEQTAAAALAILLAGFLLETGASGLQAPLTTGNGRAAVSDPETVEEGFRGLLSLAAEGVASGSGREHFPGLYPHRLMMTTEKTAGVAEPEFSSSMATEMRQILRQLLWGARSVRNGVETQTPAPFSNLAETGEKRERKPFADLVFSSLATKAELERLQRHLDGMSFSSGSAGETEPRDEVSFPSGRAAAGASGALRLLARMLFSAGHLAENISPATKAELERLQRHLDGMSFSSGSAGETEPRDEVSSPSGRAAAGASGALRLLARMLFSAGHLAENISPAMKAELERLRRQLDGMPFSSGSAGETEPQDEVSSPGRAAAGASGALRLLARMLFSAGHLAENISPAAGSELKKIFGLLADKIAGVEDDAGENGAGLSGFEGLETENLSLESTRSFVAAAALNPQSTGNQAGRPRSEVEAPEPKSSGTAQDGNKFGRREIKVSPAGLSAPIPGKESSRGAFPDTPLNRLGRDLPEIGREPFAGRGQPSLIEPGVAPDELFPFAEATFKTAESVLAKNLEGSGQNESRPAFSRRGEVEVRPAGEWRRLAAEEGFRFELETGVDGDGLLAARRLLHSRARSRQLLAEMEAAGNVGSGEADNEESLVTFKAGTRVQSRSPLSEMVAEGSFAEPGSDSDTAGKRVAEETGLSLQGVELSGEKGRDRSESGEVAVVSGEPGEAVSRSWMPLAGVTGEENPFDGFPVLTTEVEYSSRATMSLLEAGEGARKPFAAERMPPATERMEPQQFRPGADLTGTVQVLHHNGQLHARSNSDSAGFSAGHGEQRKPGSLLGRQLDNREAGPSPAAKAAAVATEEQRSDPGLAEKRGEPHGRAAELQLRNGKTAAGTNPSAGVAENEGHAPEVSANFQSAMGEGDPVFVSEKRSGRLNFAHKPKQPSAHNLETVLPLADTQARFSASAAGGTSPAGKPAPELPISDQSLVEQIKAGLAEQRSGWRTVTIKLWPENLGKVDIRLVMKNHELAATFLVEQTEVKDAMLRRLDSLKEGLQMRGLEVKGLEIRVAATRSGSEAGIGADGRPLDCGFSGQQQPGAGGFSGRSPFHASYGNGASLRVAERSVPSEGSDEPGLLSSNQQRVMEGLHILA